MNSPFSHTANNAKRSLTTMKIHHRPAPVNGKNTVPHQTTAAITAQNTVRQHYTSAH